MQVKLEQLESHTQKQLAPIYLISGDVPLLVQEAGDMIRTRAREQGCDERIVMDVNKGFNWNELLQTSCGLSLFSQKRLIELRLPTGKPGDAGSKALQEYARQPAADDVLLIVAGKLEAASRRSKWYKALDKVGVTVQVWPLSVQKMPGWIHQRMSSKGFEPTSDAVTILADRVEGNLLAGMQEIEKLHLLYGPGPIDADAVINSVADSARFDVYGLVDSALAGNAARTARILGGLRSEGVESVLVLWALSREIRTLAKMSFEMQAGTSMEQTLMRYGIWEKRKVYVKQGLKRHSMQRWWWMLRRAGRIDRMIKGISTGNVWDELLQLSLTISGVRPLKVA